MVLSSFAMAQVPSRDEQFSRARDACRPFTDARIAMERSTGVQGVEPKGENALRWLVDNDDASVAAAVADTQSVDSQLYGNAGANALPIAQVVHKHAAEVECFAKIVMQLRRGGAAAPTGASPAKPSPTARSLAMADGSVDPVFTATLAQADKYSRIYLEEALTKSFTPVAVGSQGASQTSVAVGGQAVSGTAKQPDKPSASVPGAPQTAAGGAQLPSATPSGSGSGHARPAGSGDPSIYKDPKTDQDCVLETGGSQLAGYVRLSFHNSCGISFWVKFAPGKGQPAIGASVIAGPGDQTLTIQEDKYPGEWWFEK